MIRHHFAFALLTAFCSLSLAAQAATVQEVRVERRGGGLVDESAVRAFTSVQPGDELSRGALARDVRALEQSGRFAYVATDLEDAPGGVILTYVVRGKPRIRMIRVEGADEIGNAKVRELLELGPGDLVDNAAVAFKAVKVREHYAKKYFPYADLKWKINTDEKDGTADLLITVHEGKRAKITHIRFPGDIPDPGRFQRAMRSVFPWFYKRPPVTAHEMRRVMKQRQANMWSWLSSAGTYKPDELDGDTEVVRRLLMDRGYLDAKVGEPQVTPGRRGRINVTVPVNEGAQYHFGQINVTGPKEFPASEIADQIKSRPGDLASLISVERAQQAVRDFYGSRGYIRSNVKSVVEPRAGEQVVDLNIAVGDEGDIAHVRDVHIRGNTRTKDKVIRREVSVLPGDTYNQVKARTSEARLRNLNYFDFVSVTPEDTPIRDEFDLGIEVTERPTGQFLVGAGFSSIDKLMGFVELSQGNFDLFNWPPVGGGQKLRLRGTVGTRRDDVELSFTEPWLMDRRLALNVNLFYRNRSYFSSIYDQRNVGGNIGIGVPLTTFSRLNISYDLEQIQIRDVDTNASPFFLEQEGSYMKSAMDVAVVRDSRDSSLIASRGSRSSISGMWAGGPLGGDVDVYSLEAQNSTFIPVWFDHVLNLRAWTSVVEPHGDMDEVPIFERLFMGGASTLRGFKYRKVGPKDENREPVGGETAWYATAEYTVPIFERLRFATFYDIGYVYEKSFDWDFSTYNSDWGIGVRIDIPGFPLRLDYAWPLEKDPDDTRKAGRFQFNIGYQF